MLKKLTLLLSFLLVTVVAFSGCSCSSERLSFDNSFNNGAKPSYNHKETLTYNVAFEPSTDQNAPGLPDYCTLEYTAGKYLSSFEVVSDLSAFDSDIIKNNDIKEIYSLTTEFTINIKLTINGTPYENTDAVTSKVYFAPQGYSFAPIYSESHAEYLMPAYDESSNVIAKIYSSDFTVNYSQNDYKTSKTDKAKKYDFLCVIDNAQLLFALRNIKIAENSSFNISVLSESYGEPKTLSVTNKSTLTRPNVKLKYNGEELTESITCDELIFRLNSTSASGSSQKVVIQSAKSEHVNNYALPVEYERNGILFGSSSAGILRFSLAEIEMTD